MLQTSTTLPLPVNYAKAYEDENTLVAKLVARGLKVDDESELRQVLRVVGYYRLTGYLYPFRKVGSEDYEDGTTLTKVWRLYSFDRRLRLVAADALARIEVAVRAKVMEYHTAFCNGDPFAYCKQTSMPGLNGRAFVHFVESVDKAVRQAERANNPAVVHHIAMHGQTKIPVWVLMERRSGSDVAPDSSALRRSAVSILTIARTSAQRRTDRRVVRVVRQRKSGNHRLHPAIIGFARVRHSRPHPMRSFRRKDGEFVIMLQN